MSDKISDTPRVNEVLRIYENFGMYPDGSDAVTQEEAAEDGNSAMRSLALALEKELNAANAEIADLKAKLATARDVLDTAELALNDWINVYAPEFCDEDSVARTRSRISQKGTIGYIADVISAIRSLKSSSKP